MIDLIIENKDAILGGLAALSLYGSLMYKALIKGGA